MPPKKIKPNIKNDHFTSIYIHFFADNIKTYHKNSKTHSILCDFSCIRLYFWSYKIRLDIKVRQRAIFSSFLNWASHKMQKGLVFWIISSFFITTTLAEEIPEKVSEFRSKRFFDNFDFINTSLAEGTSKNICLR